MAAVVSSICSIVLLGGEIDEVVLGREVDVEGVDCPFSSQKLKKN